MEPPLPQRINVQGSGRSNLDGVYAQIKDQSRAKPCYVKGSKKDNSKKDRMYLYWLHGKWKLGCELDSHKSFAFSKDKSGKDHPCEPSRTWKVYDHKVKDYVAAPSDMKVCAETVQRGRKRKIRDDERAAPKSVIDSNSGAGDDERAAPKSVSDSNSGADVGKDLPVTAAPTKPKQCLDDVPLCFKIASPQKTSELSRRPSNPNDCSSPEISPKKAATLSPRPSNPNDCNSPEKTLQPTKQIKTSCTPEEKKAASWFEAKIRTTLAGLQDPEQQQRKLDLIKQKLSSDDFSKRIIKMELAHSIIDRVQLDFDAKRKVSLEGKPSPRCPHHLPGQPTTPPEFFLTPKMT